MRMGGMAFSLDCLVARPASPQDSHLYPESKCSVATNLCRAAGTSARELEFEFELEGGMGEELSLRRWE